VSKLSAVDNTCKSCDLWHDGLQLELRTPREFKIITMNSLRSNSILCHDFPSSPFPDHQINMTINPGLSLVRYPATFNRLHYTSLSVDDWVCTWKAIEAMAVASSELATTLALYCRMLRIRRGPNTNICTTQEI